MNLLQSLYCNQYAELKKNGRDATKAKKNGIVLISVMIVLNIITVVLFLLVFAKTSPAFRSIDRFFHQFNSGRSAGRLLAFVLFIVIGAIVYLTAGRDRYYNKTIRSFEEMNADEQKRIEKRGLIYVILSFALFLGLFIMSLI